MSKETSKNNYVNDLLKKDAINKNQTFYFLRTGKCNYKTCQSACCRFIHIQSYELSKKSKPLDFKHEYHNIINPTQKQIRISNGFQHTILPFFCPSIEFNGDCKLHGMKDQPHVCRYFPMHPDDGVYRAIKHICGFKFKKIKFSKSELRKNKNACNNKKLNSTK